MSHFFTPEEDALHIEMLMAWSRKDMASFGRIQFRLGQLAAQRNNRAARSRGGKNSAARRQSEAVERAAVWQEMADGYWRANPGLSASRVAELIFSALQKGGPGVLADVDTIRKAIRNPNRK